MVLPVNSINEFQLLNSNDVQEWVIVDNSGGEKHPHINRISAVLSPGAQFEIGCGDPMETAFAYHNRIESDTPVYIDMPHTLECTGTDNLLAHESGGADVALSVNYTTGSQPPLYESAAVVAANNNTYYMVGILVVLGAVMVFDLLRRVFAYQKVRKYA